MKSWIDWNQDGSLSEDEVIIEEKWAKDEQHGSMQSSPIYKKGPKKGLYKDNDLNSGGHESIWNNDLKANNNLDIKAFFKSEVFEIPTNISEIWLRARVVCENSLTNHADPLTSGSDDWNLVSYVYQDLGEPD